MRDIAARWGQPGTDSKSAALKVIDDLHLRSNAIDKRLWRDLRSRIEALD